MAQDDANKNRWKRKRLMRINAEDGNDDIEQYGGRGRTMRAGEKGADPSKYAVEKVIPYASQEEEERQRDTYRRKRKRPWSYRGRQRKRQSNIKGKKGKDRLFAYGDLVETRSSKRWRWER